MTERPAWVAAHFRAQMATNFNVAQGDVYPGGHGMVVREEASQRRLSSDA